ncbi:similar to An12g10450 [Aspergillus luchuensis]|uniref:Similar to An12g10450 n=1 Tax=Aspergillus kawachii TaxID=1069201 RepID=A0A146EX33_ASPKA|nr:similar to An12g10450 [Aspergillus luchuensis]
MANAVEQSPTTDAQKNVPSTSNPDRVRKPRKLQRRGGPPEASKPLDPPPESEKPPAEADDAGEAAAAEVPEATETMDPSPDTEETQLDRETQSASWSEGELQPQLQRQRSVVSVTERISSPSSSSPASADAFYRQARRRGQRGDMRRQQREQQQALALPALGNVGDVPGNLTQGVGDLAQNTAGRAVGTLGNTAGKALGRSIMGGRNDTQLQQQGQQQTEKKKDEQLRLRLDLNLDVEVQLKAKIHGDLTLQLLYVTLQSLCSLSSFWMLCVFDYSSSTFAD